MYDFIRTQTSEPSREDIAAIEKILGYKLPNGAFSIEEDAPAAFAAKQLLLHPNLFERLGMFS